jgi:hypothetical protein
MRHLAHLLKLHCRGLGKIDLPKALTARQPLEAPKPTSILPEPYGEVSVEIDLHYAMTSLFTRMLLRQSANIKCEKPILSRDQDGLGDVVLGTRQGTPASRAQP